MIELQFKKPDYLSETIYPKSRNGDEQEDAEEAEYQPIALKLEARFSPPLE